MTDLQILCRIQTIRDWNIIRQKSQLKIMKDVRKIHDDRITAYYNKFPEEKRLDSRHGRVEYIVTASYINRFLGLLKEETNRDFLSVIDIGAGTGRYAVPLSEEGHRVTAVEFVKYNVGILKQKNSNVQAFWGDARRLRRFADNSFDAALLLGPMYHLITEEDKIRALSEAKRVTKPGGYIFVGYLMNEYSILTYGFKQHHILEMQQEKERDITEEGIGHFTDHSSYGGVTEDFHVIADPAGDLYDYVRLSDVDRFNEKTKDVRSVLRFSPDGPANYMRQDLNALSEEEFAAFINYQRAVCEKQELLGAGGHIVDVLRVEKGYNKVDSI